jgi:hypothetical protein
MANGPFEEETQIAIRNDSEMEVELVTRPFEGLSFDTLDWGSVDMGGYEDMFVCLKPWRL